MQYRIEEKWIQHALLLIWENKLETTTAKYSCTRVSARRQKENREKKETENFEFRNEWVRESGDLVERERE